LISLTRARVRGITHMGGTILGTTNRNNPLHYPMVDRRGRAYEKDRSDEIMRAFRREKIDALIAIGGDGSLAIANAFAEKGLRVIGVPKTIDNDLEHTVITFGYDTAVSFATDCLDRLHSTAQAHKRVMVVEVMGRYAGWIALNSGISGSADAILIPEIPYDIDKVAEKIEQRDRMGRQFSIVVVAEGAKPIGGEVSVVSQEPGRAERLGGLGERVARNCRNSPARKRARGSGPLAARRFAYHVRSLDCPALWRGGGARPGGRTDGRDGGARSADGALRAAEEGRRPHEDRAAGLRHDPDGKRIGNLLWGLSA
jgi:6-phosphofructokinase